MLCPMRPSVSILWPYYKKRKKRPYIIVAVHAEGLDLLHDPAIILAIILAIVVCAISRWGYLLSEMADRIEELGRRCRV